MKHGPVPALILSLCTACAPLQIYHKPGVSVKTWQADTTRCEVKALRDAPVAERLRQTPPRYIPPRKLCDGAGVCTTKGGVWIPGRYYTVDVNRTLRGKVTDLCMAERGYASASIPPCPSNLTLTGSPQRLPNLTDTTCFLKTESGQTAIITP